VRPQELDIFLEKIKQADCYHARSSSTPTTDRSHIDSPNHSDRLSCIIKLKRVIGML
jgi:hypothetical protein